MSHFKQIQFKAQREMLLQALDMMGLQYTEYSSGIKMVTRWAGMSGNDRTAHILIDRESLRQRAANGYRPGADVGFVLNDDGTYSPIIDEYEMRGANTNFGQQLAQQYFELAATQTPWEVVSTEVKPDGTIKNTLRKRQQVRAW